MTAITRALSAALLHFVWQGLAVTILLWLALFLLRKRSASLRYAASCAALVLLVVLPAITTWALYQHPAAASRGAALLVDAPGVAAPAPAGGRFDWLALAQAWAVPVWSCGVMLFSLRMAWGCTRITALRRTGETVDGQLRSAFAELAGRMGVTRPVRVLLSTVTDSPSVTGWLRPVVLLPVCAAAGLTPDQLEAVLAHELAHIRRHDYLVNLLQMAAETLLFYHPAVWWISARIRHERELCCDDLAVRTCGGALSYARALMTLEKMRAPRPALALGSTDGPLFHRIRRLVMGGGEYGPSKLSGTVALTLGLACLALCVDWARGQEPMRAVAVFTNAMQDSDGVTVNTGGTMVLHRPGVEYPEALSEKGVQGTVSVEANLDVAGQVIDARVLSGPNELRRVSLASVLNWHFAPGGGNTRIVQITFQPPAVSAKPESRLELRAHALELRANADGERHLVLTNRGWAGDIQTKDATLATAEEVAKERIRAARATQNFLNEELASERERLTALQKDPGAEAGEVKEVLSRLAELQEKTAAAQRAGAETEQRERQIERLLAADRAMKGNEGAEERARLIRALDELGGELGGVAQKRLAAIEIRGLSEEAAKDLLSRLPLHEGDTLTTNSMEAARQVVRQFDEHLEFTFGREPEGVHLRIHPAGQKSVGWRF